MKPSYLSLAAALLAVPQLVQAQKATVPIVAAHYPAGVEGIKGASLPPAGFYFRDYNIGYYAVQYNDGPPEFKMNSYVNAPRLIWMTDAKILGADYGMDILYTFGNMDWQYTGPGGKKVQDNYFGGGDIQIEPLLLSWHAKSADFAAGYAFWAPTGNYSPTRPDMFIQGFWSHMITLGGTFYFDEQKTLALSLLNRYEFCQKQEETDINPGQVYTVDFGLSKTIGKTLDVGLIGYWQQQTTLDTGGNATYQGSNLKDSKIGLGPEISVAFPSQALTISLRYAYEFQAHDRPSGNFMTLTLTKRL
jgi:hypothetical protein